MGGKKYHNVLKLAQAIVGKDRGTHISIFKNIKTSKYICNSTLIGDTYVPCCFADVSILFKFILDVLLAQYLPWRETSTQCCLNTSDMYIIIRNYLHQFFEC